MRVMDVGENPADVIKKIDDFIENKDNSESIIDYTGKMMVLLDKTEEVINNIEDDPYRKEMLGYIQNARIQVMNIIDALDSMLEV